MTPLAPYQLQAKKFLLDTPRAGLFMGMGLGKTLTTLSALEDAFLLGMATKALIVGPLRVINLTWPAEIATHGFDFKVATLRDEAGWKALKEGTANVYLINYEALPKLYDFVKQYKTFPVDVVVLDELTRAKSPSSKRINKLRRVLLQYNVPVRWGLTGTPAPNSYQELYAQIRLLDDGKLFGKSAEAYTERFFEPENRHNPYPKMVLREGAKEKIESMIAPITLTLKTSDYLKLPDIIEEDVEVKLPQEAVDAYRHAEKTLLLLLEEKQVDIANAAVLSGKLLQICSGAVYDELRNVHELHTTKLDALASIAKGRRVLVASNYVHERQRILKRFPDAVDFGAAVTDKDQDLIVSAWNAGKIPMLVADPRSAGHGLNFQFGGSTVVWFSPNYSCELYDQMNGRLFRRGQKEPVTVYRICASNTIDEAVLCTLEARGKAQNGLLEALKALRAMRKPPTEV
jgi:SNF2 family DNA or RNA helicase